MSERFMLDHGGYACRFGRRQCLQALTGLPVTTLGLYHLQHWPARLPEVTGASTVWL